MIRVLLVLALSVPATAATAAVPPVLVPPHTDTLGTSTPSAPLLVPGQASASDSANASPQQAARGQYALGRELERTGHPAPAIVAYRTAVKLDPDIPDAHFRMGRLFSAVSQHRVAAREYESELAKYPGNIEAERWLGLEQAQMGDSAHAIPRLEGLTRRDPNDEPSWQALGFAYAVAGRPAAAQEALHRALALNPKDADAWRDLGTVMSALRRDGDAREALRQSAKLDPGDASVYVNLGNLERRVHHYDDALAAYRHAVELDSSQALGWRGQLGVCADLHRPKAAGDVYRRWLASNPAQPAVRMEAMKFFDAQGRKDIALELARDGVRAVPGSGEARLALGMALHQSGKDRQALGELRRAQELMHLPEQRARVGALLGVIRAHAPDSLRGIFAADSLRYELPGSSRDSASGAPLK